MEIISEDTDKRTENSKTFRLSDGTFEVAQYQYPIHYKDSNGKWQNINNSLKANTDTTVNDDSSEVTNETDTSTQSSTDNILNNDSNSNNDNIFYSFGKWIKSAFFKDKEEPTSDISFDDKFRNIASDIKSGYENNSNDFKVKFAENSGSSALVRVKSGSYKLTWSLDDDNLRSNKTTSINNDTTTLPSMSSKVKMKLVIHQ